MDPDLYEFQLSFTIVECDECGTEGFADDGCCVCGARYDLDDQHVRRRRRQVLEACRLMNRASLTPGATTQPNPEVWADLGDATTRLMRAVDSVARGGKEGPRSVASAVEAVWSLRIYAQESPRLRPWLSSWTAIDEVLEGLENVTSAYLGALTTGTAPEAELLAAKAQRELDHAGRVASEFSRALDSWNADDAEGLDPVEALPGLAMGAFRSSGARSMIDLDRLGRELFVRTTGESDVQPGIGLQLQIAAFLARMLFDERLFWRKARTTYLDLMRDPSLLRSLAVSPRWIEALGAAIAELRDIAIEVGAIANATGDERFEIRSLVRLGGRLFEPVAVPLLAPILAVRSKRSLDRLLRSDPAPLVKQIRDAGRPELTDGILAALRDADAHAEYSVQGTFMRRPSRHRSLVAVCRLDSYLAPSVRE